ncbi:hypothetical protein [Nannocystis bainbridge]|uniref:Uncharacterized protein n=1 Tax=Nannocystis bainbridge TaxID=2995303 RepID=A0ABT5E750_9BACT|nr:hypothetical protein [Nannocystis bainbridge]MDC0721684.1 hypothetical protein [Nannocystis bainbridge]
MPARPSRLRSGPEEPTQGIECNADLCVCLLDDVDVGQCPSDGVCMDGGAIFDKMASCCDFG